MMGGGFPCLKVLTIKPQEGRFPITGQDELGLSLKSMQGAAAAEIMTTLGHTQLATAQFSIHWAQDSRASLAEKSASHITAALEEKPEAKVVPIMPKKTSFVGSPFSGFIS
ncbi:hypothetical protein CCP3SC15_20008 [Gammaproteobacteria bacterium]